MHANTFFSYIAANTFLLGQRKRIRRHPQKRNKVCGKQESQVPLGLVDFLGVCKCGNWSLKEMESYGQTCCFCYYRFFKIRIMYVPSTWVWGFLHMDTAIINHCQFSRKHLLLLSGQNTPPHTRKTSSWLLSPSVSFVYPWTSYKWNRVVGTLLSLSSFIQHYVRETHASWCI